MSFRFGILVALLGFGYFLTCNTFINNPVYASVANENYIKGLANELAANKKAETGIELEINGENAAGCTLENGTFTGPAKQATLAAEYNKTYSAKETAECGEEIFCFEF